MNTISENIENRKNFSLRKAERLSSQKIIEKLFAEGDSILQYPLKMVFLRTDLQISCPAQTAFTASKKGFKKAVTRNRIKRLLRETYRINKHLIYDDLKAEQLAIFIIFIGKEIPKYHPLETAMRKGLNKIIKKRTEQKRADNDHQN